MHLVIAHTFFPTRGMEKKKHQQQRYELATYSQDVRQNAGEIKQ